MKGKFRKLFNYPHLKNDKGMKLNLGIHAKDISLYIH